MVKQYPKRLEISNPGGLVGDITPQNILHHPPAPRNPLLVNALVRLRLVNRSNLGVSRMFKAFLLEGKPPPLIEERGESVTVTFLRHEFSEAFRFFAAEESAAGRDLDVDHLLVLVHLLSHPEIDTATAARLCQRGEALARETLNDMEAGRGYVERGGALGRGATGRCAPISIVGWVAAATPITSVASVGRPPRHAYSPSCRSALSGASRA